MKELIEDFVKTIFESAKVEILTEDRHNINFSIIYRNISAIGFYRFINDETSSPETEAFLAVRDPIRKITENLLRLKHIEYLTERKTR